MLENHHQNQSQSQSQLFHGIRFLLLGFHPLKKSQVSQKLIDCGAVDVGQYCFNCTHVIVDKLVYDDPQCVAARQDGKILVSSLWLDHSFDIGAPVDTNSVMYVPVRDLNGITGAKSLVICLTGYQREDREDIMTMVALMGAQFSKPLIATKVTHLICYKFEGEKYLLAKRVKRIKLINHRWLEDCLKAWEILPEEEYSKSGYELEMEAEAKDSEDEQEGVTTRHDETKLGSPRHSLLSKQEIPNTVSNTTVSNKFGDAQETVSVSMKTTSDQFHNPHGIQNVISVASEPPNHYEKAVSGSSALNNISASTSANKSPQNEAKTVVSVSYCLKDTIKTTPVRTTPSAMDMKSNTNSAKRLNKLNLSDAFNMSSSRVEKVTSNNGPAFCSLDEQNGTSSNKTKMDISCGRLKLQQMNQNNDFESAFTELKKDPPNEMSPAKRTPSKTSGRKSKNSKGENIICDVTPKTSTSEFEELHALQTPRKEYKETNLSTKSPSAACTLNSETKEQSGGSNSKPVTEKSISKKLSAPIEMIPAQNPPSNASGRKPLTSKGESVICDVPVSRTATSDIEDLHAVQKPQKEYKESNLFSKSNYGDVGMAESVMQSPPVVSSDLQKSCILNSETNEQSGGSNPKPVRRKSISKKFSAPKLSKKITMNKKGSIFLKSSESGIDDEENVLKYQQNEKVSSVAKSCTEVEKGINSGMQIENKSKTTLLFMDDETEAPDDKDETNTEKHDDGEQENNVDVPMNAEVKKNTACFMKEVTDKKSLEKKEPMIDNNFGKQEISEATSNRAKKARRNGNDLEKPVEVKITGGYNDPRHDDVHADRDIEEVVNEKETERNKRPLSKTKKVVSKRNGIDLDKSVEVKRSGVCNDSKHDKDEKGDHVDADMDIENIVNTEIKRNKRPLSKSKKDVSKRNVTNLEKSADVVSAEGVCNDPQHKTDKQDDDVDADMDFENVVNKNDTAGNKRSLSKTKKDVSKRNAPDLENSVDVERAEGVCNDLDHNNDKKDNDADADMDIENVVNKKETKRNKHPLGKTKKVVSKRSVTDPQHKNVGKNNNEADKDAEGVLKKESKTNKRPLSRTKKDDAKAVNKKAKPMSNQAVETFDFEEAQKENVQINDQSTGNKHVSRTSKKVLEKNTDKADMDIVKNEPMWFILTGHTLQRKEFQQIIRRLKGRVCRVNHNWSYQATHFIVPDPIKRTEKFFAAAASGRWILKTDYLSASNQAGKFLAEEAYEWHKKGLSEDGQINLEAPRKWRLLKEKTGHGAFYGMKIVIYGECIAPSLDTLKRAVKAGDGTIMATSPPYNRFLNNIEFAVVSPGMPPVDMWVQEFLKHEIPCVTADYLVEYVCKPGYPLERHVLFGTNEWAERSYDKLKKRLEEDISEPTTPDSSDVACEVCGSRDRGEEMLICGDEGGSIGCGVGTHIDCCDPPLEDVPEEDWLCSKCSKNKGPASRVK